MANEKISQYTATTSLASGDLLETSKDLGAGLYGSRKFTYATLITEVASDLTLQMLYNSSTQPQITTSIANGGLIIRNGQALDTNTVFEIKNIADAAKFTVGGNGIVANGDWQATAIAAAFGGTGQTSYTIGDLIYASNTTAIAKLGIGTAGQVLTVSGGGLPSWTTISSGSNLATANLTSNAAVRSYTLAGTASTDYLDFLSGGGSPSSFFRLQGDKIITFGNSAAPIKRNLYYMSSAGASEFLYYRDNSQFLSIDASSRQIYLSGGTGQILMSGTTGVLSTYGDSATIYNYKANGDLRGAWGMESGHGNAFLSTSAGARNIYMNANGWCAFNRNTSVGVDYNTNPSARLQVAGPGATSGTWTAFFQNSSSVNALKIRDDGYVITKANNGAIADGDLANSEMSFYLNEGSNLLICKVKYSSGTVKTTSLALV